jgi:hypothetical protein
VRWGRGDRPGFVTLCKPTDTVALSLPPLPPSRPSPRRSSLPNPGLWEELNSLVTDGLLFVLSGFRRSARGGGGGGRGFSKMGKGAGASLSSAEPTPLFAGSSSGSGDGAKGAVAFGEL